MSSIKMSANLDWLDPKTRLACKYAPVVVEKDQSSAAIERMKAVLNTRIATCQKLAAKRSHELLSGTWFSFLRAGPTHEPHLRPDSLPILVLSGGAATKVRDELTKSHNLAWHPVNVRGEPVYLIVHKLEFKNYDNVVGPLMSVYRNLHLIGWDGGALTGFGAARSAALAFADSLPYRPQRIIMMDQDVVQSTKVRYFEFGPGSAVERAHEQTRTPLIGLGVGYPTRVPREKLAEVQRITLGAKPKIKENVLPAPEEGDYNSPVQQAVSIVAPFRSSSGKTTYADGPYPSYMVSGGEDMLMGMELSLSSGKKEFELPKNKKGVISNSLVRDRIVKKDLEGGADTVKNEHWMGLRVKMLEALYEVEKSTDVSVNGEVMSIAKLVDKLESITGLKNETYNISSCIIERIILRLHKLGAFPKDVDRDMFRRLGE